MGGRGAGGSAKLPSSGSRNSNGLGVSKSTDKELQSRIWLAEDMANRFKADIDKANKALKEVDKKSSTYEGIKKARAEVTQMYNQKVNNLKQYYAEVDKRIKSTQAEYDKVSKEYSEVAKALNYTNSNTARSEFDRLSEKRRKLQNKLTQLKSMQKKTTRTGDNPLF